MQGKHINTAPVPTAQQLGTCTNISSTSPSSGPAVVQVLIQWVFIAVALARQSLPGLMLGCSAAAACRATAACAMQLAPAAAGPGGTASALVYCGLCSSLLQAHGCHGSKVLEARPLL